MSDVEKMTADEMIETLTGFDEIAIAKWFNAEWSTLIETSYTQFSRALVFIDLRRKGDKDPDAYKGSQELTLKGLHEYFPDDEEAALDPDSESGKDSTD